MKQTKGTKPLRTARPGIVNDRPLENLKRAAEKVGLILHARPAPPARPKTGKR